jgi:TM2 domain-containing membrane protein YozV
VPYAPPPVPLPSAYTAPQQQYPLAPAPTVVHVVVQQPQAPMQQPVMMAPMAQMVPYGHVSPTGIVRVGNANRLVFAVLAFLLGFIGLHKFYQGKPVWGLIYLLTSWTGVPAIVSVIEGLLALFQSDAAFDADNNLRSV